ncbi:ATP-dependent DNA ligase [Hydrogenophaga sp.]|uniref:ATP-dependent DNA ligase n=1 Tax=Hydrogenophaga sp. TaxID=1904254 RepID=UPI0025C037EC|nr:ATP-dependent DNA ligase [Hydrogenophaga sp.]
MKRFALLYRGLDASTATREKQAALQRYLQDAPAVDAAWAVYFLAGGKPRQTVPTRQLRELARELTGLPEWLFEESYQTVGDLAETVSLLLPPARNPVERGLAEWLVQHLLPLRGQPPETQAQTLRAQWAVLPDDQRFVYFKLITGGFRVGVSRLQVTQALAAVAGVDAKRVAQRLMGYTATGRHPTADDFRTLIAPESAAESSPAQSGQPYPFFLAHPFNESVERFDQLLGPPADWQIEWKWDGIRAQLVKRAGQVWLWSRGEELVTDRFPELVSAGEALPDGTVLDGEILVWRDDQPQPFADLQKRIGRKTTGPKLLRELPVVLLSYDLLEHGGQDWREHPLHERRTALDALLSSLNHPQLPISASVSGTGWRELASLREQARERGTEGFMLKQRDSRYGVGRTKAAGTWWKWKIDPMSADAVLIYAQRGHGRRASVYSDYTFAVWDAPADAADRKLVPFAKAYSGLTDAEMAKVDAVIRQTTVESFGPVRSVRPTLVFELGFEGISRSPRHKSGIAVRFPRMLRWREDKPVEEADTLQTLAALLPGSSA